MSLQLLVIMVPVLFAMMGFALDLGRMYLVRGELNQAANAMALAAAQQLLGTDAATGNATTAAESTLDDSTGTAPRFNFGSIVVGQSAGNLTSTINPPIYYDTLANAVGGGGEASSATARHVQISLLADSPLLFWSLLPGGETRKNAIAATAIAGISAPLCVACGIEPIVVATQDPTGADTIDFGFIAGTVYTFNFTCTGTQPVLLAGTTAAVPYVLLNRFDSLNAVADDTQQAFRDASGGLVTSPNPNPTTSPVPLGCVGIGDAVETIWPTAPPGTCTLAPPAPVISAMCGLVSRFDGSDPTGACANTVTDYGSLVAASPPDTDLTTGMADPYTTYRGNGRRIITVPIVAALATNTTTTMTIQAFRQFLLEPNQDGTFPTPGDPNGRFAAMYIGSPAPLKQGWMDDHFGVAGGILPALGPGKVVLHR